MSKHSHVLPLPVPFCCHWLFLLAPPLHPFPVARAPATREGSSLLASLAKHCLAYGVCLVAVLQVPLHTNSLETLGFHRLLRDGLTAPGTRSPDRSWRTLTGTHSD